MLSFKFFKSSLSITPFLYSLKTNIALVLMPFQVTLLIISINLSTVSIIKKREFHKSCVIPLYP